MVRYPLKICSVVGARPQFIKAASVSRALSERGINEILVHTGQHYDANLSDNLFKELDVPAPRYHLGVGSGTHAAQTGTMLPAIEECLEREGPRAVLVYGDTNTTLAGALAAAKINIPVAHVEAGVRSFNRTMPEEINRVVVDHISSSLFCPSDVAVSNLAREGIKAGVFQIGDVMLDVLQSNLREAEVDMSLLDELDLERNGFVVMTIHRAANTDSEERLRSIINGLQDVAATLPVVFPVHPRTRQCLSKYGIDAPSLRLLNPLSYLSMLSLQAHARVVVTDSGGMQKEAYWLRTPCITVRDETEWVETVRSGWNCLVSANAKEIARQVLTASAPSDYRDLYGDGRAGQHLADALINQFT